MAALHICATPISERVSTPLCWTQLHHARIEGITEDILALSMPSGSTVRKSSGGYLSRAEELMADAVGAEQAFFSTCGSSLSVKAAMLAVAGGEGELLISRDAHKSVVAAWCSVGFSCSGSAPV